MRKIFSLWKSNKKVLHCQFNSQPFEPPIFERLRIELTVQYLLVTFPQRENFSHSLYLGRHGQPAPWRSLLRKSSSPKASVNIAKDFRASSSPCATQALRHATSSG